MCLCTDVLKVTIGLTLMTRMVAHRGDWHSCHAWWHIGEIRGTPINRSMSWGNGLISFEAQTKRIKESSTKEELVDNVSLARVGDQCLLRQNTQCETAMACVEETSSRSNTFQGRVAVRSLSEHMQRDTVVQSCIHECQLPHVYMDAWTYLCYLYDNL